MKRSRLLRLPAPADPKRVVRPSLGSGWCNTLTAAACLCGAVCYGLPSASAPLGSVAVIRGTGCITVLGIAALSVAADRCVPGSGAAVCIVGGVAVLRARPAFAAGGARELPAASVAPACGAAVRGAGVPSARRREDRERRAVKALAALLP